MSNIVNLPTYEQIENLKSYIESENDFAPLILNHSVTGNAFTEILYVSGEGILNSLFTSSAVYLNSKIEIDGAHIGDVRMGNVSNSQYLNLSFKKTLKLSVSVSANASANISVVYHLKN